MTVDQFDVWTKHLTEEAHEYQNKDARETRNNVNIDDLLETDLVSDESLEDEYFSNFTINEIHNKVLTVSYIFVVKLIKLATDNELKAIFFIEHINIKLVNNVPPAAYIIVLSD